MRHGNKHRKFRRETEQRKALLRALAVALIEHGKITTTQARAKSLRIFVEKLISASSIKDLAAFKKATAQVGVTTARRLTEMSSRFSERRGGYTRIRNLAPRLSDGAKMAVIEFVD